jgi:hypothetical protein
MFGFLVFPTLVATVLEKIPRFMVTTSVAFVVLELLCNWTIEQHHLILTKRCFRFYETRMVSEADAIWPR